MSQQNAQASVLPLALLVCCSIGLFFLLVSWAAGGQTFFESLYGYQTLGALLAGLIAGAVGTRRFDANGAAAQRVSHV